MDHLDSFTRHELSKFGYTFARNLSVSHIVKTLLKDISKLQNISEDVNQLCRRNNDLSLASMLYKTQLEEKDAELKILTRNCEREKEAYQDQIRTLEGLIPRTAELPKCDILRALGVTESNRETLELIRYADTKLHKLENTNRTLMNQLDKNVMNSGLLINKIKVRDAEIQRLTQLVNNGSCSFDGGISSSASTTQNKLLREENARLQSEIDQLRGGDGDHGSSHGFKAELEKAVDERRELARQLDHYTSKVTTLQKILHKYEHELKMARLERDNAVSGCGTDKSTCNAANSTEQIRKNVQDENGNVTNYGSTATGEQQMAKSGTQPTLKENEQQHNKGARTDEKLVVYERKIAKLLKDLSILQDAVTKKDSEISQLRGEVAIVGVAHEENLRLRSEVTSLRKNAADFKNEFRLLREHVKEFTSNAARAADVASHLRQMNPEAAEQQRPKSRSAAASENNDESGKKNQAEGSAPTSASLEAPVLLEKVALLECEMRRLQAQAALDVENRLRTETRLREMEQNPPKKFKGLLKIDGGVMRTEFEMGLDSPPR